ncbi:MAG: hypothetical protein A2091_01335 [Desulfuromonadales bacterium GWD2_61_12]|nr:MAG: hypothetical protein A2091_01335 [Desulfuromonadales bacterium GWD2_61_12]HAD05138.1 chemotaxis response regulator protein-glutamate methylesterase [Desulfuromonas sp.]HBT82133.1 chemotaxis response regulator protein-glutamate methylesterase [Desulfuromonas sp.]
MVRVLIADDSELVRTVLRDLLARDPDIEVVAEVADGHRAVAETCRLRPDLVIMDIVMPVMDGLDAVMEIMATCPTPILVLSGNVDPQDCRSAFNAIRLGALDVMEKPVGVLADGYSLVGGSLIDRVKALARVKVIHHYRRRAPQPVAPAPAFKGVRRILAIGASTGGPKVVMRLMRELPSDLDARVVIVQHIATGFAPGFAEWLDRESGYSVRIAKDGMTLERGVALVAPNGQHMEVRDERIALTSAPPLNSCRPAVDALFSSLARPGVAAQVAAVLLTGMGRDGAEGMAALKQHGAATIAQDEASCTVFGMPKAAIDLGAVDQTLTVADIPAAVTRLFRP